ncbi:metallophosphoesterase family protein [Natrinema salsiterrestre]|uniref:Metallophosphatase family protein n=1 Tax=Natrinema salsiterrestre TaxID=2950540 RepID=A0A9Q4Q4S7_9EURY|nr:metallophosphoesterase family protein [Natrinema salsiterrestre]MDF9747782.1 metallophosphatase family protein [Natrinema salsiterrestre]
MTGDSPTVDRSIHLLVVGDIHLRPTGESFPVTELPVTEHDLVVSIGDVIDENRDHAKSPAAGDSYEERGREFFEYLDTCEVPVVAIPGNHDPVACTQRLTDGLDSVTPLHRASTDIGTRNTDYHVVGWGCKQFDFPSALLTPDYPDIPLDDKTPETPDTVAQTVLEAAGRYITGSLTRSELADQLGIKGTDAEDHFRTSLAMLEERFEEIVATIRDVPQPVLLASHVSPFAVPFDRRKPHAHDGEYHFGSLGLRLALMETGPVACISGHTHQQGFSVVETANGHTYVYNPGAPGVASVTVDDTGTVRVDELLL